MNFELSVNRAKARPTDGCPRSLRKRIVSYESNSKAPIVSHIVCSLPECGRTAVSAVSLGCDFSNSNFLDSVLVQSRTTISETTVTPGRKTFEVEKIWRLRWPKIAIRRMVCAREQPR